MGKEPADRARPPVAGRLTFSGRGGRRLTQVAARLYSKVMGRNGDSRIPVQAGALPWRPALEGDGVEILLLTARRSQRWLIPKGWPMLGKSLAEAAAQEAFEEAGIRGTIDPNPIGSFRHIKQHPILGEIEVEIHVHPLAVEEELHDWPERRVRTRSWFRLEEAGEQVASVELSQLIVLFGRQLPSRD